MNGTLAALAPFVRPLPCADLPPAHDGLIAMLDDGLVLIVADRREKRDVIAWTRHAEVVSRSRIADRHAVLRAPAGEVGLDMESTGRIALNATARDAWLAEIERGLVERSAVPIVELACHWVLKEAYGKALGVGLDLPLGDLAFGGWHGAILLQDRAATGRGARWRFGLYRQDDLLFGTAYRPRVQPGTPLAPAGRKPPTPLADR